MKLIIGVITGIVILYPFVELVYVIKTKRYCEAYSNTGSSTWHDNAYNFIFSWFIHKRVYQDTVNKKYKWMNLSVEQLDDFFGKKNITLTSDKLECLYIFWEYVDRNYIIENMPHKRKLNKNIELYTDLDELYKQATKSEAIM